MSIPISVKLLLVAILTFAVSTQLLTAQDRENDDKIRQAYKSVLSRTPKEGKAGSPFDRLYRLYLEGPGIEQMVVDYQAEARAEPDNPNTQLVLGHIYKRLGQDDEALVAYKKSVALGPTDYYSHLALGQICFTLRRYEDAIASLTQAAGLFQGSDSAVSTEELILIYKSLGRAYFNRDRVDEAIAAWQKIAELAPANMFARVELADLFREQKLYQYAIEQHRTLIEIKRDDPYRICLSLREIGSIQEEMNDYHGAIDTYNEALTLTAPDNWIRKDLQDRIIAIYAATGDWAGLIEYYQKKLVDTPKDPELISLLADAYLENEQLDVGIAQYKRSVELAPTSAPFRRKFIDALRRMDKLVEAAAEYETLSIQVPDDFGIYRALGTLYLQLEQPDRARAVYKRMLAHDSDSASTHLTLAEIYTEHKWFDEAVASYEKAIALAPTNLDYIEYLGEFYLRRGNRDKALETWNRLVERERASAQNYERLAQLLHAKEFRVEAVAASRRAVELAPTEYRYREMLAKQLMDAKNFDAAIIQFADAAKYAPNDFFAEKMAAQQIEVYQRQGVLGDKIAELQAQPASFDGQKLLAKMYLKLRNTTAATAALEKALELNPDDIPTNRWLAELYAQLRRHDRAKAAYARLVTLDSVNAREYYANLARIHLGMMDFNAAKETAKRMLAHSPRNPEGHRMLAEVARTTGDYLSAIESLEQAIRLGPQAIEIRVELAEAYTLADDLRQSIEQYWRCWELSDSVNDKLRFVRSLSNAYYDMGRSQELSEKLQQMSRANSSDMAPVLALAEVYRIEGDLSASRVQLARALDRNRGDRDLLSQLVDISLKIGDMQGALTYQQRLVAVEPDARNQRRLGKLLFEFGREQEAVQVWTKLLHGQNQSLEALMKLAELLIQYDLRPLAFSALERIAEQAHKPQSIYRLGTILLEIGESERARPYFERILHMPRPQSTQNARSAIQTSLSVQDPLRHIVHIGYNTGQQFRRRGGQGQSIWLPQSFEDTQIAALAQLRQMAWEREELEEFINGFEAEAAASPKDLQRLERLLYIYMLRQNEEKAADVLNRMIALSPHEPTYYKMRFHLVMWDRNFDSETVENFLSQIPETMSQVRLQYTVQSAMRFIQTGKRSVAQKLLRQFRNERPTNFTTATRLITAFSQLGDTETAENLLANCPTPSALQSSAPSGIINPRQTWRQYADSHRSLAGAYIEKEQTDKAVELLWSLFKQPQSNVNMSHWLASSAYTSYRNYSSDLIYPAPNTYYDRYHFELLQQLFGYLLMKDQLDILYTKLQTLFELGSGRERVLSGLALSYCYWWEGRRDESQQLLKALRAENSEDLTLKRHMPLVLIQTGKQEAAVSLLTELAESDPRNRQQYNNLRFFLAEQDGHSAKLRELATEMLNSPASVRELMQFSQRLHEIGLTQYAIAIAKRAMKIALGQNDLNSLGTLSRRLKTLGRGHDAAAIARHVARLTKLPIRPGQRRHSRGYSPPLTPEEVRLREPELVKVVERHPDSFKARKDLATFYENTNRPKKALPVLASAVALRSKDSELRYRYAELLRREKQMDKAVEQYTLLLKSDPNVFRDRGHGNRTYAPIEIFTEAGKFTELVAIAKEITLSSDGGYESTFVESVAWRCIKNNASNDAVALYERLIAVRPDWADFHLGISRAYTAAGDRDQAIECIRNGLNKLTRPPISTYHPRQPQRLVAELVKLDRGREAYSTFLAESEARLAAEPNNLSLTWLIAYMYIKTMHLEASDPLVAKLIGTEQNITESGLDSELLTTLADAYQQAGDLERHMKILEAVVERRERQTAFWNFVGGVPSYLYELLGETYVQNGEKEKAQRLFQKIIPMSMALSWWDVDEKKQSIARLYMQLHMWDEAEALFSEIASNVFADAYRREQAKKKLAEIRKERGDLPVAPQLGEEIGRIDIRSQREKAMRYTRRGKFEQAVEIYKQLIESMPEDHRSVAAIAKLYTKQEMHEEAISTWQSLLKIDPENTQYWSEFVDAYRAAGMSEEALEILQKLIAESPSPAYYSQLALVYMGDQRFDDAVAAYRKGIELDPNNWQMYKDLGQLYTQIGDLGAAETTYKTALPLMRNNHYIIAKHLAEVYAQQSELADALQKMEAEGILTFGTLNAVAQMYHKQGELEKASTLYKKAFKMTTDEGAHSRIAEALVRIYREKGRLEEILKKAKEVDTPAAEIDIQLQKVLAKQYMETGEIEKVVALAKQVILHDPEDHGFRAQLAEYYWKKQKKGDMAVAVLKALIEDTPNETYQDQLIDTYADFKRYREAIALAQKLCEANPSSYRYVRLARVYKRSNRLDDAVEAYKEAIRISFADDADYLSIYQDVHRELAELYIKKEDFSAAEKTLKALGDDNRLLTEVYRHLGKWEEVLRRAEAEGTRSIMMLEELAKEYHRGGKLAQAATAYQKLLGIMRKRDSDYQRISDRLTQIYRQQSNWEEAIKRAGAEGILTSELLDQQAQVYRKQGKLEEAIAAYKKAIDINSQERGDDRFTNELISLYLQLGDFDAAIALYERSMSKFYRTGKPFASYTPSSVETRLPGDSSRKQIIESYKQGNKLHELVTYLEGRFKRKPESPAIVEMLAETYNHLNEHAKAAEKYKQLSKLQPTKLRTFYLAAAAFNKSGQPERTKEMLNHGATGLSDYRLDHYHRTKRSKEHQFLITVATICIDGGLYDTAVKFAEDAIIQAHKDDAEGRLESIYPILGEAFIDMQSYEKAANAYHEWRNVDRNRANAALQILYQKDEGLFERIVAKQIKAVEDNPDDTDVHHALAETYVSNDKRDKAIGVYEKLCTLQPDNVEWFKMLGNLYQLRGETAESVGGSALRLNGDGSYADVDDSDALNASHTQLTLEVWIKLTKSKLAALLYKGHNGTSDLNRSFVLWLSDDDIRFSASPDGWENTSVYSSVDAISLNKWHHIAAVLNTEIGSIKLYIDGIPVASNRFPNKPVCESHLPLRIGSIHSSDERYNRVFFEGELADLRIWSTARTAQQIRSHMNVALTGNEPGLIGFVRQFGEQVDAPPNHLGTRVVGSAEVVPYSRPIFVAASREYLTKSVEAYERAIVLEPTAYQLYDALARNYLRLSRVDAAEATYHRAIDAVLELTGSPDFTGWPSDSQKMLDSAIRRLWQFYVDHAELEKAVETLETLKSTVGDNATLHKLLGDTFKELGDGEKSDTAYAEWFEIRKKEIYDSWTPLYASLAAELLDTEFRPQEAVKFAALAMPHNNQFSGLRLLCRAYIANGGYTEAADEFKRVLKNPAILAWPSEWSEAMLDAASVLLWLDIAEAGRKIEDKTRYIETIEQLANSMPDNPMIQLHVKPELSKLYSEQAQLDKSRKQ